MASLRTSWSTTRSKQTGTRVRGLRDGKAWHPHRRGAGVDEPLGIHADPFDHLDREFRAFIPSAADNPNVEFQLPTVVDSLIRQGRAEVEVLHSHERWLGVTYPEDKPRVAAGIRDWSSGVYPQKLVSGPAAGDLPVGTKLWIVTPLDFIAEPPRVITARPFAEASNTRGHTASSRTYAPQIRRAVPYDTSRAR